MGDELPFYLWTGRHERVADPGESLMNKMMLIVVVAASMLWLGGCMVISCDEHRPPRPVHVVHAPPVERVEVIQVPGPAPRPHWDHRGPRGWR